MRSANDQHGPGVYMRSSLCFVAFLAGSVAFGQPASHPVSKGGAIQLTTLAGDTVTGTFSRVEPDGIIVTTDSGIQRVSFTVLPDEIKQAYGYSPEAEEQLRQQRRQQQAAMIEKTRQHAQRTTQQFKEIERQKAIEAFKQTGLNVTLKVLQVTQDGCLCSRRATVEKIVTVTEKDPEDLLKIKVRTVNKRVLEPVEFSNDIFVIDIGRGMAGGQSWKGIIWRCGTYSFTTVIGAQRTLQAFSADPERAMAYAARQGN